MKEVQVNSVMLVDDNDTDNFIHKRVIELTGFAKNIIVKNSGKSALEFLESNKSNLDALPDLIFLDINMPIVDGFVFEVREENTCGPRCTVHELREVTIEDAHLEMRRPLLSCPQRNDTNCEQ